MRNRFALGCMVAAAGCSPMAETGEHNIAPRSPVESTATNYSDETVIIDWTTVPNTHPELVATVNEEADRLNPPTTPPTTTPPTTAPPIVNGPVCTQAEADAFAHQILDPYGIPTPEIMMSDESYYAVGRPLVSLKVCETLSIAAHEIAHYVHSYTYDYDLQAVKDSALEFASGTWIKGREVFPGIEIVAHCVGNVIFGNSPYTKCPDEDLKAKARAIINLASQK